MATADRSAIARIASSGSAREGVSHWKLQRLTAIANVPLVLWFIWSAVSLSGATFEETRFWLASPFSTVMMVLLVVSVFWHAKLGVQVVIEDYVHHEGVKIASLVALNLAIVALAVSCLVAILKISVGS